MGWTEENKRNWIGYIFFSFSDNKALSILKSAN